jgi:hypothetical protein
MKTLFSLGFGACIAVLGTASASAGDLVNGSFEFMNFYGWKVDLGQGTSATAPYTRTAGSAAAVASWTDPVGSAALTMPETGLRFAALHTRPNANFTGDATYNITLSQEIALNQGDLVSGWSSFYNGDFEPQDSAWVKIFDQGGNQIATPWQAISGGQMNVTPSLTPSPSNWTLWEWQTPTSGSYTIQIGMTTGGNNNNSSYGFFDGLMVQPATSVPEPSVLALAAVGTILFTARRRQKV